MSLRQLAERAGISKTAVQNAEANEAKGTVQLDSLRALAAALDCELVYALVPRSSLSETLSEQAARAATRMVDRVSDSMELEEQGIDSGDRERQVRELAGELLRNRRRDFWDV
jgi:predicted DNA-binding mobile mystery protein A